MSTISVAERIEEVSPRTKAAYILSHESVFRLGFAATLVELACQITMTALIHDLLKPVRWSGLSVFSAEQLHALALLSRRVDYHAEAIAMVFFGFSALLKGYLVFRSTFLPRILGVLSAVWLTYLYEPLACRMAGYIVSFAVVAGFSTALWLLVFGVNEKRWWEQAKAAGQ